MMKSLPLFFCSFAKNPGDRYMYISLCFEQIVRNLFLLQFGIPRISGKRKNIRRHIFGLLFQLTVPVQPRTQRSHSEKLANRTGI